MAKSARSEIFIIENAILSFPHLFQPQVPSLAGATDAKYSASFLVDEQTAALVWQKAQEVAANGFRNNETQLQKFKWPLSRAAEKQSNDGSYPYRDNPRTANLYIINATANVDYPPQVVNEQRQPVIDRGSIYAGCIVAAGIQLFTFNTKGNVGVSVGLSAVMKTGDGEALGGGSVDAKSLFANVKAQAPAPGAFPSGAPMPSGAPAGPFGQPTQPPAQGMPPAPFGQPVDPNKPPFM